MPGKILRGIREEIPEGTYEGIPYKFLDNLCKQLNPQGIHCGISSSNNSIKKFIAFNLEKFLNEFIFWFSNLAI